MYSLDLPQGGLELPCHLNLSGPSESLIQIQRLINVAAKLPKCQLLKDELPKKKAKLDNVMPPLPLNSGHSQAEAADVAVRMVYLSHTSIFRKYNREKRD